MPFPVIVTSISRIIRRLPALLVLADFLFSVLILFFLVIFGKYLNIRGSSLRRLILKAAD